MLNVDRSFRPQNDKDWQVLEALRSLFIGGESQGAEQYWNSRRLLELYEATFAQRIAAKWEWVLQELARLKWAPAAGAWLDWGCGTGVASRIALQHYRTIAKGIHLSDHSKDAVDFARRQLLSCEPTVAAHVAGAVKDVQYSMQVISHVISELSEDQLTALCSSISAESLIWVEPGSRNESRRLGLARKHLIERGYHVVAPCFHETNCGLLESGRESDWCHFFAKPDHEFFRDAFWARFADRLKIDLHVLPVSFLVMDRRPLKHQEQLPDGLARVIGAYKKGKAHYLLSGCDQTGVTECRFSQRNNKEFFKALEKGRATTTQCWKKDGREILGIESWEA